MNFIKPLYGKKAIGNPLCYILSECSFSPKKGIIKF